MIWWGVPLAMVGGGLAAWLLMRLVRPLAPRDRVGNNVRSDTDL